MQPKETVQLATTAVPLLAFAPPVIIGAAIGLGILWLITSHEDKPAQTPVEPSPDVPGDDATDVPQVMPAPAKITPRRIMREDLAEALAYGERAFTRMDAVAAIQGLGFGKSAAYKALSPDGKFADLIDFTPDGLVEWKG